jgi:hypothetical protein
MGYYVVDYTTPVGDGGSTNAKFTNLTALKGYLPSMRAESLELDEVVQAITKPTRTECQAALKEIQEIGPFSAEVIVSLIAVIDKHTKVLPWNKKRSGNR